MITEPEEKREKIPVNIRYLEQAHGVDLSEFAPGVTYPLAKLMDALGFMKPGRPYVKRSNRNPSEDEN